MDVEEWEDLPRAKVATKHPVVYDSYKPDMCQQIDLRRYLSVNQFDAVLHAYNKDGFRITCQKIVS